MTWLSHTDDEVGRFHPVFAEEARRALELQGLDSDLEWIHHPLGMGRGVPDYALSDIQSGRWLVTVEIKRTESDVWSTQYQLQAKGYAEANAAKYRAGWPRYFCIANLEVFVLGALNGASPPSECVLEGGVFDTAALGSSSEAEHRDKIRDRIAQIVDVVLTTQAPQFDQVWPRVIRHWIAHSEQMPLLPSVHMTPPGTPGWSEVSAVFEGDSDQQARRVFLLRCLAAEYARGVIQRHQHPRAATLRPLTAGPQRVARALEAMQGIDLRAVIEPGSPAAYAAVADKLGVEILDLYVASLGQAGDHVAELSRSRTDAPALIDSLFSTVVPFEDQPRSGKVQTDPGLAAILATLSISDSRESVVDVGCGDGALVSAAFDRLVQLGARPASVHAQVTGIEADPLAIRLAALRLALKEPRTLSQQVEPRLHYGDVFVLSDLLREADVLIMNPPFRRYESSSPDPAIQALRVHYGNQIRAEGGEGFSEQGQSNLYSFYVEFLSTCVKQGATVGIVLDNKWYQNRYCEGLRSLILKKFEIQAVVEYPHTSFFREWDIATSLLVARRTDSPDGSNKVRFARCGVDPRGTDLSDLSAAFREDQPWPHDWTVAVVKQKELNGKDGWKSRFSAPLQPDFRSWGWPGLDDLFTRSRRGSLQKEGNGIDVLEFPFGRVQYGPRREKATSGGQYSTSRGRPLTTAENSRLAELSSRIPQEFRGWALKNSDVPRGFELNESDVLVDQTLEAPALRGSPELFRTPRRSQWTALHDSALDEFERDPDVGAFVKEIESTVNMTREVLSDPYRWNALREPIAGELIIPRKQRTGHRIHVNPFAWMEDSRQVRLSSNFITYSGVVALAADLNVDESVRLIASFLLSTFGEIQFEIEGYNREGMLAVEKEQLARVRVFDPRWVRATSRQRILEAYQGLPYPMPIGPCRSSVERVRLDELWADEIAHQQNLSEEERSEMLGAVWDLLDEYISAREP